MNSLKHKPARFYKRTTGSFIVGLSLFAYLLARFAPMVSEAGMWGWVTAAFLSCSFIVVVVWVEFRKAWRRT